MKEIKNILVVRTDRIGDVILTAPAFKSLRSLYPSAHITVLVSPLTQELIKGNSNIDEIIVDDRKGQYKGFWGFVSLASHLRNRNFDIAIVYHTKKRTNALCFLAGIPVRVGYKNDKFDFLLSHPILDQRREGKLHESQYCIELLKHLPDVSTKILDTSLERITRDLMIAKHPDSDVWVNILFETEEISVNRCVIAIHPGASDKEKRCPPAFFIELIQGLIETYQAVVFIVGAKHIKDVALEIIYGLNESSRESVIDLVGITSIMQLASILKKSSLLISNDSGPVHIAAALQTPVISLFVRNEPGINPERWRPLGKRSRFLAVPPQKVEENPKNVDKSLNLRGFKNPQWQEFITKDRILEEVDSLFKL